MNSKTQNGPDGGKDKPRDTLEVVVNGAPTTVSAHGNPTLLDIVTQALAQTENAGQPVENWELRSPEGAPLPDLSVHLKKLGLPDGSQLFLNLRAGIGG